MKWLGLSAVLLWLPLQAATFRLDDSASPRARVEPQLVMADDGRPLSQSLAARTAHVQFGRIDYRLATASYVGRDARIYYVVPASIPGLRSPSGLQLTWQSQGSFASGSARPGQRTLVWSGKIREAWLTESFVLNMQVQLAELIPSPQPALGFESYFEIDVH
jgi:hypothetical protein